MFQGYELDVDEQLPEQAAPFTWPFNNYVPDVPHDTFDPLSDPLNDPFPEETR
jgi:hypothetical protein